MLGKKGFVERVNRGVDQVLEPGETRQAATYLRGQGGSMLVVSLFGPMVTQPFILALTDRRLLLLAMGQLTAAHSTLIAAVPRQYASVRDLTLSTLSGTLTLTLQSANGPQDVQFALVPAWKDETAQLAQALGWAVVPR